MKLGLSTWSLLGIDVYSAVRVIGDAGIEYVELWGELPHAYPQWVDERRLRDVLSSYGMALTMHAPFTDLNPAAPDQGVRAAVQKALTGFVDFSASLGASIVTAHPGSVHNEQLVAGSAKSSLETISKMVKAADGRLTINIENQARSSSPYHHPLGSSSASMLSLLAGAEGTGCTLDTGHAHASGIEPAGMQSELGDRVAEIHLSDNGGSSDDHLIPGEGSAPLRRVLERAAASEALVCLELNPHLYGVEQVLEGFRRTTRMLP
ncbi:MAG: sugar phosphate isomerase/epimerase [Nitrososphaerota archaeon]|nr:sugar phosphate isomerase/epimerase [Nitrososphaerota archaeon]